MYTRPRRGPSRGPRNAPPVREGEEIDVIIEAVGEKGDGIAKKDGFILFVKDTKQGETCRVRVTKVLQKVGFADKIGPAESEPKPSQPKPQQVMPDLEPEPVYEDTETFGDEMEQPAEPAAEVPEPEVTESEEKEAEPVPELPTEE